MRVISFKPRTRVGQDASESVRRQSSYLFQSTCPVWAGRKWGGIPTGITQNVKDLLASREVENIFENSDFVYLLNQASGDRQILSKALNISPSQQNYITNSNAGEGLIFYGSTIVPFKDDFPKDTQLYRIMTTRLEETTQN